MLYYNPNFSSPIHVLYDEAVATNNTAILEELSMTHVHSVFHNFLIQSTEYEFLPDSKFGPLLLQRTSGSSPDVEICFFQPENGLELCYYLLDDMVLDIFFKMMEPFAPFLPVEENGTPCTAEQEQTIREKLASILDQFPLTKDVLFDSVINYPRRLYI